MEYVNYENVDLSFYKAFNSVKIFVPQSWVTIQINYNFV